MELELQRQAPINTVVDTSVTTRFRRAKLVRGTEMNNKCDIVVVPHTHWDREWYKSFEQYRFYLVRALDELIEAMEDDASFTHFLLDGQTIVLEDYLEMRPERGERLRRLMKARRITAGPWYLQPDEQLVSGESLVRNLLIGHRMAADFGAVMKEGYVPDTFGHIAQLPQILQGFDIPSFYTMRGTAEDLSETGSEVYWQAPDGSRVWSHHLLSYSNAAVVAAVPEEMALHHGTNINYDSLTELRDMLLAWASSPTLLLMNGNDHLRPQPGIADLVRSLNDHSGDNVFLGSLTDFRELSLSKNSLLPVIHGERTSGRYQKILQGVLSTRLYLKQRNAALETFLSRVVEPLWTTLWVGGADYPATPILSAWKHLIRNHPHDSICGCSIDRVHRDMVYRFDQADDIAGVLLADGMEVLASRVEARYDESKDEIALVVFNPSQYERGGEVRVAIDPYIGYPYGKREFAPSGFRSIELADYESEDGYAIKVADEVFVSEDMLNRRKNVRKKWISVRVDSVPALGCRTVVLRPAKRKASSSSAVVGNTIENEFLVVTAGSDGTLSVREKASERVFRGLHFFEDEADRGDEYTFCGIGEAAHSSVGTECTVERMDESPVSVSLRLRMVLRLPSSLLEDRHARSPDLVDIPIVSLVTLHPGKRFVEIVTTVDNRVRDHRFRAVFSAGFPVKSALAESAFCVLERSTDTPDGTGWTEQPCVTHAQQRYVAVEAPDRSGGLAILNRGLPEYEVSQSGDIKLTLLRCVQWLSRPDLDTRPGDAGPQIETPEAQCQGVTTCEYAIVPFTGTFSEAEIWRVAEDYTVPFVAARVRGPGEKVPERAAFPGPYAASDGLLSIHGAGLVLTALKRAEDDESMVVRLFNTLPNTAIGKIDCAFPLSAAWLVNLNEEKRGRLTVEQRKRVMIQVTGYGIVTLKLVPEFRRTGEVRTDEV